MKESKLFRTILATIVVVALGAPAYATADANDLKGKSVKVSYADLNLEKYEGAKVLYHRLKQASKQACFVRGIYEIGSLTRYAEGRRCYRDTLTRAVAEIDSELLTQIHSS